MTALDMASDDPQVHVVVLTGAGAAFCAGGDLQTGGASEGFKAKEGVKIPATKSAAVRTLRLGMTSSSRLREMDKITIAAVNGACAGAGFSWACACDLRFAADAAIFRAAFATAGLSGDYGGTWTLPRIVGPAKARELYLMNRKIKAAEAERIGLCSGVFPKDTFMQEILKIAKEIAAGPPLALKRIKQNLNNADRIVAFAEALDEEAERHAMTAFHPDAKEAGRAFVEKRQPKFQGIDATQPWLKSKL
eukprot:gnl/MRDRNA2_/MRDRNA2_155916_c0_seq1.p1 gnl/MRDRNA2_/MRDRNA2_155916_c0~~gnl/MRDRNA2_/MRDRNA2_155916_c0_seq1.p1  ORF type:complete len:275 (+),score=72.23 gnl/MRDRNA2_/MRDRNA2_155916_c0_seq1:79-825(+)